EIVRMLSFLEPGRRVQILLLFLGHCNGSNLSKHSSRRELFVAYSHFRHRITSKFVVSFRIRMGKVISAVDPLCPAPERPSSFGCTVVFASSANECQQNLRSGIA